MHIFQFSFYLTAIIYAVFVEQWLILCFLACIFVYCLISWLYPNAQTLSTRRKFTLATWSPPSEGIIYNNIKLRVDRLLAFINTFTYEERPTITHFVIRACGEVLKESPDMNGKLVFGKFVPYSTCDVSCFVNIDSGNDVGAMLVKDVPNKSISQIGVQISSSAGKIRVKGGDQTHKKRMGLLSILPSFLIALVYKASIFFTSFFGVNIPSLGLQKDQMGAIIVSSVGGFGYIDAYTAFFGTVGQWILLTVNNIHQQAIVVDGKIEIASMININCVIDHRYLYSGGRGKKLLDIFENVFNNPQKFVDRSDDLKKKN